VLQPQPGEAVAERSGVHGDERRADVQQGALRKRAPVRDPDVHHLDGVVRVRGDQHPDRSRVMGPVGEGHGDTRDAGHLRDLLAQALEPAYPHWLLAEQQPGRPHAGAGGQRAGDDGAGAAHMELPVHPEPYVR
jgi:hypothetical protein